MPLQVNNIVKKISVNSVNQKVLNKLKFIPLSKSAEFLSGASHFSMILGVVPFMDFSLRINDENEETCLSEKELVEKKYIEECEKVSSKLIQEGCKESAIEKYIEICSYIDKQGLPVLNSELMLGLDSLKKKFPKESYSDFENIMAKIYGRDENDNIIINQDVVDAIDRLREKDSYFPNIDENISASYENGKFSKDAISFVIDIHPYVFELTDYYVTKCYDNDGFNKGIADVYRHCLKKGLEENEIENILLAMVENKNGKKIVKPLSFLDVIFNELNKEAYNRKIHSISSIKEIVDCGCCVEDYLNNYHRARDAYGDKFLFGDKLFAIIGMSMLKKATGNKDCIKSFDPTMVDIYKKYEKELISEFDSIFVVDKKEVAIAKLINACKVLDPYKGEVFDENILKKALLLMEKGVSLYELKPERSKKSPLAEVIDACKISDGESIKFDNKIFEFVLERVSDEKYTLDYLLKTLKFSKEYDSNLEKEYFNYDAFDLFFDFIRQNSYRYVDYSKILKKNQKSDLNVLKFSVGNPEIAIGMFLDLKKDSVGKINEVFNFDALNSFREIEQIEYNYNFISKLEWDKKLLAAAFDKDEAGNHLFNSSKFEKIKSYLERGFDAAEVEKFKNLTLEQINVFEMLVEEGIDFISAENIVSVCVAKSGKIDEMNIKHSLELYDLGMREVDISNSIKFSYDVVRKPIGIVPEKKVFNEQAFLRIKELYAQNLPIDLINSCKENKIFKDRLFVLLMNLKKNNYPKTSFKDLMDVCQNTINENKNGVKQTYFEEKIYEKIFELEKLGIGKADIAKILDSCKFTDKFSGNAYNKIPELFYRGYDSSGIRKVLSSSNYAGVKNFSIERYNEILSLTQYCKILKNISTIDDVEIIKKLLSVEKEISHINEVFGKDVLVYATSLKIDNYIKFVRNCAKIFTSNSSALISELVNKIKMLPSPDLKVKRLQMIGALSDKTKENVLLSLVRSINSPEMTLEQKGLISRIFSNNISYPEQIGEFLQKFKVPAKNQEFIKDFLMKLSINEQVQYPESIEKQLAQMDIFAQQMLTNPRIPLEKKIKYINEYSIKKADMQLNPEKYTTPRIYTKVMNELQKVVEAYVNIPNLDNEFNNSILDIMYKTFNIESTEYLLNSIKYDSKYFDRLLVSFDGFRENFKALVELVKLNEGKKLSEMRVVMPKENSLEYKIYERYGLIDQIKANLDTKRQFEENGLSFEKWNKNDLGIRGNNFDVDNDSDSLFLELQKSIVEEIQGQNLLNVSSKEITKFLNYLKSSGYDLENDKLMCNGEDLTKISLGKFIENVIEYFNQSEYFKSAIGNGGLVLSDVEINAATALIDHFKGFNVKYEEAKVAKSVSKLHLRLADFDDIGRNIFFGNHVSCCNSVESSHAGFSAPQHLLNSYVKGIEIVDEYGNSYGNSLCYFALIDGKLSFVMDSFEAIGKLASNPIVTENIIAFAKQVCADMDVPEANIFFGPNYNKLNMLDMKKTKVSDFKILGMVSKKTYCDVLEGSVSEEICRAHDNVYLYAL